MATLSSCNPLLSMTSFMHSVATGNTVGTVTGGFGIVIEKQTGKGISKHLMDSIKQKPKREKPKPGKRIEWVFQD